MGTFAELKYKDTEYPGKTEKVMRNVKVSVWSAPVKLPSSAEQGLFAAWETANNRLDRALKALRAHPGKDQSRNIAIQEFAAHYFLLKKFDVAESKKVMEHLQKTKDGLAKATTIRVCDEIFPMKAHGDPAGLAPSEESDSKNAVLGLKDRKHWLYGDIHMKWAFVDIYRDDKNSRRLRNVTLIHEAMHKFAGAYDYCYFDFDGKKPTTKFDSSADALINADSLAWFAYHVGRKEFRTLKEFMAEK